MALGVVPADRLAVLVERFLIGGGSVNDLSSRSGLHPRCIWGIRNGDRKAVTLSVADKLLVSLDAQEYFHLRPEDGGLADCFEAVA